MLKSFLITILCLCAFSGSLALAANNALTFNYPASSGSYNKATINTQAGTNIDCTLSSNKGLLYINPQNKNLELCANTGQSIAIPYPEVCFNRFSSTTNIFVCPKGYYQRPTNDTFSPNTGINVNSTVCCSSTIITPSS